MGIDTTAITLGSTAQVQVMLPAGYRDDDADDEVTADELSVEELARQDEEVVVAELEDDESDSGDIAAEAAGDPDAGLDDEDPGDPEASDAELAGEEASRVAAAEDAGTRETDPADDAEDRDPVEADGGADAGGAEGEDPAESAPEAEDADVERIDPDGVDGGSPAVEDIDAEDPHVEAPDDGGEASEDADIEGAEIDGSDAEYADADLEAGGTDGQGSDAESDDDADAVDGADLEDPDLEAAPAADADLEGADADTELTGDRSAHEAADEAAPGGPAGIDPADADTPADETDAVADSPNTTRGALDDAPAQADDDTPSGERTDDSVNDENDERASASPQAPITVREPRPVPAAVSEGTASKVEEAARVGRPSFLKPPARSTTPATAALRADQMTADADRESSDVLTDERLLDTGAIRRPEPEDPWRRIIYSATRGAINLGDGKRTRARKALMARIAAPLAGRARFVPVLSRKGGVGKTTVTALLGMALADARSDRVVAVDANPDRGTLAERIATPSGRTVRDLVRGRDGIRGYGDISAHVVRDDTRLDVLASDPDPHIADAFSDADYREVAEIAQHYYSIVLTDTGTGIVHSVMEATLDLADQLVVVSGTSVDEARLASETLTWLETNGRAETARKAVVVINQDSPATPLVRLDELESHFRSRVGAVVRLPYDPRLATGSAIPFHELGRRTRDAARQIAALVVEGIRIA